LHQHFERRRIYSFDETISESSIQQSDAELASFFGAMNLEDMLESSTCKLHAVAIDEIGRFQEHEVHSGDIMTAIRSVDVR
jgi:hypothetical protein